MKIDRKTLSQLVKYGAVGVLNTFLTLGVIFLCKSMLGVNEYVSNALGYTVGFINSFMCNKTWVFHSKGGYVSEGMKFCIGFLVCYCLQLLVVWSLNQTLLADKEYAICGAFVLSGYGVATLIGNVAYSAFNFIFNKFVTFRNRKSQ